MRPASLEHPQFVVAAIKVASDGSTEFFAQDLHGHLARAALAVQKVTKARSRKRPQIAVFPVLTPACLVRTYRGRTSHLVAQLSQLLPPSRPHSVQQLHQFPHA